MTADPTADIVLTGQRERVLEAAIALLTREGRDALTTRSVAAASGLQAPTLYRLFGDKRGLLDAVAAYGFELYLRRKQVRPTHADPLDDLRTGWDQHVEFGLTFPAIYSLMVGDPRPGDPSPADVAGRGHLQRKIRRLAEAGRLRISEERAGALMHASCSGLVLTLLSVPEEFRDLGLSVIARESVMNTIAIKACPAHGQEQGMPDLMSVAVTLKALLTERAPLSPGERALLAELLDRLATNTE